MNVYYGKIDGWRSDSQYRELPVAVVAESLEVAEAMVKQKLKDEKWYGADYQLHHLSTPDKEGVYGVEE